MFQALTGGPGTNIGLCAHLVRAEETESGGGEPVVTPAGERASGARLCQGGPLPAVKAQTARLEVRFRYWSTASMLRVPARVNVSRLGGLGLMSGIGASYPLALVPAKVI